MLASSIIMVRFLPKEDYGTYLQIMLIVNTSVMLSFLGFPQSIYYFFHQTNNKAQFVKRNVIFSIVIGLLAALTVGMLIQKIALWFNNPELARYGLFTSMLIFFRAPCSMKEPILFSHGSLVMNAISVIIVNVAIYASITIYVALEANLFKLLRLLVFLYGFEFVVYIFLVCKIYLEIRVDASYDDSIKENLRSVTLMEQLKYGVPIGLSSHVGVVDKQIDQYIVSTYFTPQSFAVYSRGAVNVPVLSSLRFIINNIMMPKYVESYRNNDTKSFLRYYHQCIETVAKINIPTFAFLFAVAPILITMLYTEEYIEATNVFRMYLFLLIGGIAVYAIPSRATGKTLPIFVSSVISLVTNILLSVWLVSSIGAVGAAIATVLSTTFSYLYLLIVSCKILEVSFRWIFPWAFLGKLLLVCLAASMPIYIMQHLYCPQGKEMVFMLVVASLFYFYCCAFSFFRLSLVSEGDMQLLRTWLGFDVEKFLRKMVFVA